MRTSLLVHGAIFGLALGVAYWSTLKEANIPSTEVTIVDIDPSDIEKVSLTSKSKVVSLHKFDKTGSFAITIENHPSSWDINQVSKAAKENDSKTKSPTEKRWFIANKNHESILEFFHPFKATRKIGRVDSSTLKEFGLDGNQEKLIVTYTKGREANSLSLRLGKKSYGSRNLFVLDEGSQTALLIDGSKIEALRTAERTLFEKKIIQYDWREIQKISVNNDIRNLEAFHLKADNNDAHVWTTSANTTSDNKALRTWVDNLSKITAAEYAETDISEKLEALKPELEIIVFDLTNSADRFRFIKLPPENAKANSAEYWVWSSKFAAYAKTDSNRAANLISEFKNL